MITITGRFSDLVERGVLSTNLRDQLVFFPLDFGICLSTVDAVLHKATDGLEIQSSTSDFLEVDYSSNMKKLQHELVHAPHVCVVDSFTSVSKVHI